MVIFSIESLHLATIIFSTYIDPHPANSHIFNIYRSIYIYFQQLGFYFILFFLERTYQKSMYLNLPALKIHIHIYSIKPTKYQCKIHIYLQMHPAKYQCIQPANFNDPHTHTHTHTHIEPAIFFFFERTCKISIYSNLLTLKISIHTYICNLPNINLPT